MISRSTFQNQQFCDSLEVTLSFTTTEFGLGKEFLLIKLTKTFISFALLNSLGSHSHCLSPIITSNTLDFPCQAGGKLLCLFLRTEMLLIKPLSQEFQKGQLHKTSLPVIYSRSGCSISLISLLSNSIKSSRLSRGTEKRRKPTNLGSRRDLWPSSCCSTGRNSPSTDKTSIPGPSPAPLLNLKCWQMNKDNYS